MNDRGQSDNDLLRRSIINVATDLNAIEVQLRESGESEQVCDLLKTLRLKLKKEASFVEKYRPREPTLTLDEWMQEIATSTNESMAKICPALTGVCGRRAVENVESAALEPSVVASIDGNVASPVSLELQQESSGSIVARIDGDDSGEDSGGGSSSLLVSPTSEMDANDVLDDFDLKARMRVMYENLVERVEGAYFTANGSSEVELQADLNCHLMIGKYDIWSPMIIAKCDFSENKSSVHMLERQARAFFTLLQDRMAASAHAKYARRQILEKKMNAEMKAMEDVDINVDVRLTTASCALAVLERVEVELDVITDDDDEQAKEPYNVAAELAAEDACVASNWIDLVKFQRPMIAKMRRSIFQKIVCAVLQLIPFEEIAEAMAERSGAFLDGRIPGWKGSSQTLADVWDSTICPLLQVGAPDADAKEAYRLAVFISQRLSFAKYAKYFQMAEAILLSQLLEDCDAAQCLRSFKLNGLKSYFLAEDSQAQVKGKVRIGQERRLIATRCFFLPVTFKSAMQRIRDDDDDVLSISVYGVNSMAPSCFVQKKYKLLWDGEKLIDPQPDHEESIKSLIETIFGVGEAALEIFQKDHLILDLTSDVKNNTDNSLRRLREYFNLCIPSDATEAIAL